MNKDKINEIANKYLIPFFSGAKLLKKTVKSSSRDALVAFDTPCTIHFKEEKSDKYRFVIKRSQPFSEAGGEELSEMKVIEAFVDVVNEIKNSLGQKYEKDLLLMFQRRIVAKAIAPIYMQETLLNALDQMTSWASRLYEGRSIAAAIGYTPNVAYGVTLEQICQKDFSAVLSNGFDTLLEFGSNGKLRTHGSLRHGERPARFAPYRQGPIAEWTENDRIAVVLNRLGEIMVFRNQKLLFARRSGKWHFLTHMPVIKQMGRQGGAEVRSAVYETCLDASFARTGACIGIIKRDCQSKWKGVAPKEDLFEFATSLKAISLRKIVRSRKFQNLDRRLRQELVAIDGATILDHKGNVLTVGSILKIPSGSSGGGRLAAAKRLSKFGLGIKVSQDGAILGFHDGKAKPTFSIMSSD